jgi:hypothetical protein
MGRLYEGDRTVVSSASRDGIDMRESLDMDRDGGDRWPFSVSSSPESNCSESDGSRRKSRGDPLPSEDEALTSFFHSSRKCSMDNRLGRDIDVFDRFVCFGGGIDVMANKAATDAGRAF